MDLIGDYNKIDIIKNSFNKECIESIHIYMRRELFSHEPKFNGLVEFKNGNTGGTQRFQGKDLSDVLLQIAHFCMNL